MPMQPMVIGQHYMVSAGHYLATEAAHAILEAGGNAIDAGVAAGIALGVLQSDQVQFAGVAPMMIYLADRDETVTIAGLGGWPQGAQLEMFVQRARRHDPVGRPAHRGAGGARRLDPRAGALRHDELRRRRGGGHPLRARRLPVHPVMADFIAGQGRGLPALAAERGDLAAGRRAAARGRRLRADRPRRHDAVHGRRGAGGGGARAATPACTAARDAFYRGDIAADDRPLSPRERRLADGRGPGELPLRDRAAGARHLRRHRGVHLRAVVPGAGAAADAGAARRGRPRRRSATTRRRTSIS